MSSPTSSCFLRRVGGLARKTLKPRDICLGGIWLGPGSGPEGNGTHPDLGQENANQLVQAAVEAGIKEFDTAPWYGAGAAEERLGRALRETGAVEQAKVGTKAGRIFWEDCGKAALAGFDHPHRPHLSARICENDYGARGAQLSLEHSLNRMGLDSVHTLRIHDPNDNSNNNRHSYPFVDEVAQALAPGGMLEALRTMRDRGKILNIGLGMNTNIEAHMGAPEEVLRLLQEAPPGTFDSALLAGGWNLLCQTGWSCLQQCQDLQIEVYSAGIFASGFLADYKKAYAYQEKVSPMLHYRRQQWLDLVRPHSLPAVAIAFAALPMAVTKLVIGVATAGELQQMLEWVEESNTIPESLWEKATERGLWLVPN